MKSSAARRGSSGIALNDVLIWILIPALSYLAGALFQAGYNDYFGLPDELVSADPVAVFHASRRYLDLIVHHFSVAIAIPLVFVLGLTVLPSAFYRAHAVVVLALAGATLFISFGVRPFAWAIACTVILIAVQLFPIVRARLRPEAPAPRLPRPLTTSPIAIKVLAIVTFFYATLFSAGRETARFETNFFVTDRTPRYVMLTINDKDVVAAELIDPSCKRIASMPRTTLHGYHFSQRFKVFALGDSDTPSFQVYETDGLTSSRTCEGIASAKP